jgi:adenylate cyclase
MTNHDFNAPVSAKELRAHLEQVFQSKPFRNAEKLRRLLSYLIEAHLAGDDAKLKGYTIGIEALDRPDDFDPQLDPIVRVQAKRLRDGLDAFYANEGQQSSIRILIGKGSYRPQVQRIATPSLRIEPPTAAISGAVLQTAPVLAFGGRPKRTKATRFALALGLALAAMSGVAGLVAMVTHGPGADLLSKAGTDPAPIRTDLPKSGSEQPPAERKLRFDSYAEKPVLRIITHEQAVRDRGDLTFLSSALVRFGLFQVQRTDQGVNTALRAEGRPSDHYVLAISSCPGCQNEVIGATLVFAPRNEIIYAAALSVGRDDPQVALSKLVRTIGALDGPILNHMRKLNEGPMTVFGCIQDAIEFAKTFAPDSKDRIRHCVSEYVRSGETDPLMEQLSAFDAVISYWLLEEPHTNLARAQKHSRRALELEPAMALGYFVRAFVYSGLGNSDHQLEMAKRGYELNPLDSLMAFGYANALLAVGEFRAARMMLEAARSENTITPVWILVQLALANLLNDDNVGFRAVIPEIQGAVTPLSRMLVLIAAAQEGNPTALVAAYTDMKSAFPMLSRISLARRYLETYFHNPKITALVVSELETAIARAETVLSTR